MRVLLLALALGAASCGGVSGPSGPTIDLTTSRSWGLPMPLTIVGDSRELTISGTIDVNDPCYDFRPFFGQAHDTLVVWIEADRRESHCPQELARFAYTYTISGLARGVQPLRVVYERLGPPTFVEVAFEGAVDIQ